VNGRLVQLHKHAVVDLSQAEELKDLLDLGRDTVDTADADHAGELAFRLEEKVALGLGNAAEADEVALHLAVFANVLLSTLEHLLALLAVAQLVGSCWGLEEIQAAFEQLRDIADDLVLDFPFCRERTDDLVWSAVDRGLLESSYLVSDVASSV